MRFGRVSVKYIKYAVESKMVTTLGVALMGGQSRVALVLRHVRPIRLWNACA
jgi:hypothetical protein